MTRIDFYVDADDRLAVACRLASKAMQQSMKVLILAPEPALAGRLDRLLWMTPAIGFIPHCMAHDRLAPETPVLIAHDLEAMPHDELLLNLHHEHPSAFARFQRLVEIVGRDEQEKQLARARFRFYRDRGYQINTHSLSGQNG